MTSGGDLLYILAFIILPTAVLVSCIWALILLRKGVLLPPRPAPVRGSALAEDAEADDELGLVEETGEHTIVVSEPAAFEPLAAPQVVVAGSAAEARLDEPPAAADAVDERAGDDLPPSERTQELEVWQAGADGEPEQPVAGTDTAAPIAEPAPSGTAELVVKESAEPLAVASEAPDTPVESFDPLLVPLDELPRDELPRDELPRDEPPFDEQPRDEPVAEASVEVGGEPDAPPVSGPRRPARRIAQPRPVEDVSSRARLRVGQRREARRPGDEA